MVGRVGGAGEVSGEFSDTAPMRRKDRIADRIREVLRYVPAERLQTAPDCGMKYLPREVAFGKLRAMVDCREGACRTVHGRVAGRPVHRRGAPHRHVVCDEQHHRPEPVARVPEQVRRPRVYRHVERGRRFVPGRRRRRPARPHPLDVWVVRCHTSVTEPRVKAGIEQVHLLSPHGRARRPTALTARRSRTRSRPGWSRAGRPRHCWPRRCARRVRAAGWARAASRPESRCPTRRAAARRCAQR